MIGHIGSKKFLVNKISKDNKGRILIIKWNRNWNTNIYFVKSLELKFRNRATTNSCWSSDVGLLLSDFSRDDTRAYCFCWNADLFFNQKLEALDGNSVLKKKSISKVLWVTNKHNLIDVWKVENPSSTRFLLGKIILLDLYKDD